MNNQEKAKLNHEKLLSWIQERIRLNDFNEYERNGKINRAALCEELDFSRSVISQNPAVKSEIERVERAWYGKKDESVKSHEAARDRAISKVQMKSSEVNRLQEEIAKLKAENVFLKKKLEKYTAITDVLSDNGLFLR